MKSLCIENDFRMPEELQFFCDEHPELVGQVSTLNRALEYEPGEIASRIKDFDTFVLSSTFIHKHQLESMLEAFDKGLFGPGPFAFYVELLRIHLEKWTQRDKENEDYTYRARINFSDHDAFIERLIRMVKTERLLLYDVIVDRKSYDEEEERFLTWEEYDAYPDRVLKPYRSEAIRMVYNETTFQFERTQLDQDELEIQSYGPLNVPK